MDPPCNTCRPSLTPENAEVVDVYLRVRNQIVSVGMSGVADISIPAAKIVMDMLGVKDQLGCLDKVRHLFHEFRPREKA